MNGQELQSKILAIEKSKKSEEDEEENLGLGEAQNNEDN